MIFMFVVSPFFMEELIGTFHSQIFKKKLKQTCPNKFSLLQFYGPNNAIRPDVHYLCYLLYPMVNKYHKRQ